MIQGILVAVAICAFGAVEIGTVTAVVSAVVTLLLVSAGIVGVGLYQLYKMGSK